MPTLRFPMLNFAKALFCAALFLPVSGKGETQLPEGFVYLSDIAPEIEQRIKYAGPDNFLGRPVEGYQAPRCILTQAAARALKTTAQELAKENLRLRVFDCYRPERAVADFVRWSQNPKPASTRSYYFARYSKAGLFRAGFIAKRSGHSKGSTVDLTLAHRSKPPVSPVQRKPPILLPADQSQTKTSLTSRCDAANLEHRKPLKGALDMGTDFDCFSSLSATNSGKITRQAQANRKRLLTAMQHAGFRNYATEWWHFTLLDAPFHKQYFDFVIQ